jgi:FixJ family two-component response regulator
MTRQPVVHVVDDDESMRASLARLLGDAGYTVACYASAEEFLAAAGPATEGCILLDLRLPGASGFELQEVLAARRCTAPVIFLTAHGDVPSSVHAMKHGAWDFLQKPVRADALFEAIESALARSAVVRRERDELEELRALASTLSEREREVWLRVVRGQLNKQIAYDLGIVERTVKLHRAAAMQKLRAASAADLVRIAHRLGLPGMTDAVS